MKQVAPAVLDLLRVIGPHSAYLYLYLLRESVPGQWHERRMSNLSSTLGVSPSSLRKSLRCLEDIGVLVVEKAVNASSETRMKLIEPVDKSTNRTLKSVDNVNTYCQADDLLRHETNIANTSIFRLETEEPQVRESQSAIGVGAENDDALLLDIGLFALGGSEEGGTDYEREFIDVQFAEFWASYPNKVSKQKAYESFVKSLAKVEFSTLMESVARYTDYLKQPGAYTCKMAATYLNQGCWTDEYPTPKAQPRAFAAQRDAEYYNV